MGWCRVRRDGMVGSVHQRDGIVGVRGGIGGSVNNIDGIVGTGG